MTVPEAIDARHSVRAYRTDPVAEETRLRLNEFTESCNRESGLHFFIRYDDPAGFDSGLAHYGSFRNVRNYIVLAGKKGPDFDFRCGYWGEKAVLYAQTLGLNTCWAALTFSRRNVRKLIPGGEALCMVIALGYGETQGRARKSKAFADVTESGPCPEWFRRGVEAALKAPTAVNQQKFAFSLRDGEAYIRVKGFGAFTKVDLGIAAYHFDAVSGRSVRHEPLSPASAGR